MPNEIASMDFNDTFLDINHLKNSFPQYEIEVSTNDESKLVRPFRLTFEDVLAKHNVRPVKKVIKIEPHVPPSRGPYKANEPKKYEELSFSYFSDKVKVMCNNITYNFIPEIRFLLHQRRSKPFVQVCNQD